MSPLDVECALSMCKAQPGEPCKHTVSMGEPGQFCHYRRVMKWLRANDLPDLFKLHPISASEDSQSFWDAVQELMDATAPENNTAFISVTL